MGISFNHLQESAVHHKCQAFPAYIFQTMDFINKYKCIRETCIFVAKYLFLIFDWYSKDFSIDSIYYFDARFIKLIKS